MTLKDIVEAAVFASGVPLSVDAIGDLFDEAERPSPSDIGAALAELASEYETRPIELHHVASGYRFQVRAGFSPWLTRLFEEKPARYSRALLETLAIIAYRQPATRGEIEDIRGVAVSSGTLRTLLEREWVAVVGHKEVPGRPALYATTRAFLDYFGLRSLEALPDLPEFTDMASLEAPEQQAASETGSADPELGARPTNLHTEAEMAFAEAETADAE
jgi:segregation and condensation protein B